MDLNKNANQNHNNSSNNLNLSQNGVNLNQNLNLPSMPSLNLQSYQNFQDSGILDSSFKIDLLKFQKKTTFMIFQNLVHFSHLDF